MGIAMGAGSAAVPGGKNVYFKRKKKNDLQENTNFKLLNRIYGNTIYVFFF